MTCRNYPSYYRCLSQENYFNFGNLVTGSSPHHQNNGSNDLSGSNNLNYNNFLQFPTTSWRSLDTNIDAAATSSCYSTSPYFDPMNNNRASGGEGGIDATTSTTNSVHSINNSASRTCRVRSRLGELNPLFHKRNKTEDDKAFPPHLIKQARKTGALQLSGRGLTSVPDKIYQINQTDKDLPTSLEQLTVQEEDAWWNQMPLTNLDLSSNALTHLSPKIENLETLTTLTLHDNLLTSLPRSICRLEKLVRVNLSRNKLRELPVDFYSLPELRYLNISYNEFEELHPAVSDLHMLEYLDASHNSLTGLPNGIGFLVRVSELLLSHNHIKELPSDLVNMRSLQKLDLNHNDLIALPEDMGSLRKLLCLYLQHNDITQLPTFEGCQNLQELYVANNLVGKLPESFCSNLPHLKILDLRDNKITKIPDEISLLKNLIRLDLTNNSISNLPLSLGSLAHLVSLQIDGNPIKSIRRDILQCGTNRILRTLRERARASSENQQHHNQGDSVSLNSASLSSTTFVQNNTDKMGADGLNSPRRPAGGCDEDTTFPDKYKMRNTHTLNVTMQYLSTVPDEVFQTAAEEHVSCVDFSKNRLEKLPDALHLLKGSASELVFSNNQITKVPTFLSQFTRLTLLNLSCNQLTDLPKEMGVLNTLRELNICNNRFDHLPTCLYHTQNLEILLASDNRIKHIDATPEGLGALKRLTILDLRNNNIEQVPPVLGNLTHIATLELIGNPFRQPRHQILAKGTDAIMSYLRDRIPA
ncbi:leucine-rich repeat-containing protein 40 isoform X3 [Bactrocera tryoni]|uniref:leucine-rich repeat-containing protein 40 isoform X3 n=1 Tax=Bactrocera tryoni TaxID=59916 RepID=UPI001A9698D0|nr:leucine-rich repeat-containing protein 40 isoform X3 [Bactrocera tryoni]XP_039948399.1 leucine-rich repeat-containing protein 40 isoform X3 [Bactrocera tryoni]